MTYFVFFYLILPIFRSVPYSVLYIWHPDFFFLKMLIKYMYKYCYTVFFVNKGIANFTQNLQMFTSVYRCETSLNAMTTAKFNEINDEILQALQYKFRSTPMYCLSNLSLDVSLFDDEYGINNYIHTVVFAIKCRCRKLTVTVA